MAAISSAQTGNWGDASTWQGGVVPGNGDDVTIVVTHVVTVNGVYPASGALNSLTINGTLAFSPSMNTKLIVAGSGASIVIGSSGELDLGTVASPIQPNYTAELVYNPSANGYINARQGKLVCQGASKSCIATLLASDIAANDVHLHTNDATGWVVGDEIIVCSSTTSVGQTEKVTITGINGTTIYIDSNGDGSGVSPKFNYAHVGLCHVLNLTRNVRISSSQSSYNSYINIGGNGNVDCDWCSIIGLKGGGFVTGWNGGNDYVNLNGAVIRDILSGDGINNGNAQANFHQGDLTKVICYNIAGNGLYVENPDLSKTYSDIYAVNCTGTGIFFYWDEGHSPSSFPCIKFLNLVGAASGTGVGLDGQIGRPMIASVVTAYGNSNGISLAEGHYQLDAVKSFQNTTAGLIYNSSGFLDIKDSNSFYGTDGLTVRENGYDLRLGEQWWGHAWFNYAGNNIKLSSTNKLFYGGYNGNGSWALGKVAISNYQQIAGRHYCNIAQRGTISDPVTNGQTSAYAKGGSGICAVLNPASQTYPLQWEFCVPVTAATQFTLKFYITKTTSGFNGSVKVTIFDSNDDNTKLLNQETINNALIPLNDGVGDDWTYQYSAPPVTPTNTGFCRVLVEVLDGAATGDILIDDLSVA